MAPRDRARDLFWLSAALIVWTQIGYALALALAARLFAPRPRGRRTPTRRPRLAHRRRPRRAGVIAAKVANARALRYPRDRLQVIVCCDGCVDDTATIAREAGADLVLELPRGGKIRAQDAGVERAAGQVVAFSDANALWEPDAAGALVEAFADPRVGYACGQVRFVQAASGEEATNQEGLYWRYEMAVRVLESRLASITAGNGAIYATRAEAYLVVDPIMGHDLSFPFNMVKHGWRAVYVPAARATEKMVPSIEGEFARKRRMMSHAWPIVLRGGMLSPRGYGIAYAAMIVSHRLLRYATPALHRALAANVTLVALGAGPLYVATLVVQLAILTAAALAGGALAAAAGRALLRVDHRVAGGRTVGLGASRDGARGTRPRARGDPPVFDGRRGPRGRCCSARRCSRWPSWPSASSRPAARSTASVGSAWTGAQFDVLKLRTMVQGAEHIGAGLAVNENDARITRVGALLRRISLDELPNLINVLRGEMSVIGPRPTLPVQVEQYTPRQRGRLAVKPGITGWAQVNGRASLPWSERIELDLCYIDHRSLALDLKILWRTVGIVLGGTGLYKGETGGWQGGIVTAGILLTGVGKRYDIVSWFARLTSTVVADPNPLAPAQYAAHVRAAVPLIDDPGYVPALRALCERHDVGAVIPLTDLDIEVLAPAREDGAAAGARARPEIARATYDKYETHLLLRRLWLPSPPTVLPGLEALDYPVMVKPRRGSGARSIHLAHDAAQASFFVDYVDEPMMVQRAMQGPEFSIDCLGDPDGHCLNAIPRTMLESRGGESIKGQVIRDEELIELGRSVMEAMRVRGPATIQAFRDAEIGLGITDVNTRFGGAFPAPVYAALPGRSYPELIVRHGRWRAHRTARRGRSMRA